MRDRLRLIGGLVLSLHSHMLEHMFEVRSAGTELCDAPGRADECIHSHALWQGRAMRFSKAATEPSTAEKIGQVQERLHVMSALAEALSRPELLLEVVSTSDDPEQARARLQDDFGFDELQALAVLDAQFRNATRNRVARIRADVDDLTAELRQLQEQLHAER